MPTLVSNARLAEMIRDHAACCRNDCSHKRAFLELQLYRAFSEQYPSGRCEDLREGVRARMEAGEDAGAAKGGDAP